MKITPLPGIIHLKIDRPEAGALNTDMKEAAVEYAEVLAVGEGVTRVKKSDHIFVKAWAVDIIKHEGERYYFCAEDTNGILAVVK